MGHQRNCSTNADVKPSGRPGDRRYRSRQAGRCPVPGLIEAARVSFQEGTFAAKERERNGAVEAHRAYQPGDDGLLQHRPVASNATDPHLKL